MTASDLSGVPVDQLLEEIAKRCGSSYRPRSGSGAARRPRHATKHEWAKAEAEKARVKYHAATDDSERAEFMEQMAKFEYLAKRYKDQGV